MQGTLVQALTRPTIALAPLIALQWSAGNRQREIYPSRHRRECEGNFFSAVPECTKLQAQLWSVRRNSSWGTNGAQGEQTTRKKTYSDKKVVFGQVMSDEPVPRGEIRESNER